LRGAVLELEAGGRLATATSTSAATLRRWLEERQVGLTPPAAHAASDDAAPPRPDPKEILSR
jgi:phosphoglycolate phosphatase-like HAD superfamily hydrolase